MSTELTSRERMLHAIRRQEVDHPPCAFMSFTAMRGRVQDAYELAERELEMGMDSWLFVPTTWRGQRTMHPDLRGLPVRLPAEVRTDFWIERPDGEDFPIMHKVYHTPVGDLSVIVRKTEDWTHGNTIPFIDDFQIPRHQTTDYPIVRTWKCCAGYYAPLQRKTWLRFAPTWRRRRPSRRTMA